MSANTYEKAEDKDNKDNKDTTDYQFGLPPKNQDKPTFLYTRLGKPNALYTYRNINNEIEFVMFRDNTKADKKFHPYTFSHGINGWVNKLPKEFNGNKKYKRTLFKAHVLGNTIIQEKEKSVPEDRLTEVLIVEGEKACDKAEDIFKDPVILSWSNGTQSVEKSDWSIITDRKVYLWPDNDKRGYEAMIKIAKKLTKQNNQVYFIELKQDEFPIGWDLGDKLPNGFDDKFYQKTLDEAEHWSKIKDTINPKKFDILNTAGFIWVEKPKRFRVLSEDVWLDKEQINARYRRYNKNAYNFLHEQGVPNAWSTAFYPKRGMIFEHKGTRLLNAYKPPAILGVKKDITTWLKELDRFFGKDGDELHYYNQFIGQIVQYPEIKIPFCHHKGGLQGNGKTEKDLVVMKILGEDNCTQIISESLFGEFNDYLENNLLIFVEELNVEGKKKASMMNKIKHPISSDRHRINKKMVPEYEHYCPTHWFSNSNFRQPIYLEATDRRFYLYWSHAKRWDSDYTKKMLAFAHNPENLEGIRYYYEHYDLKGFDTSHPRMTGYKQSLIMHHEKNICTYLDDHWEKKTGPWKNVKDDKLNDLINTEDIKKYIKSDNEVPVDEYYNNGVIFDWAISRGGTALPKKSYRCCDGKKRNLIAMRNYQKWSKASEGEIKNYYVIPKFPY